MNAKMKEKVVLLVDDDEDFLHSMKEQLDEEGFQVVTADGRQAAERLLPKVQPDLAIIDLIMEERDAGFVLAHHIKTTNPDVPVIMVTASMNETGLNFDTATKSERSWIKVDSVLEKPIRFEQLRREIARFMSDYSPAPASAAH